MPRRMLQTPTVFRPKRAFLRSHLPSPPCFLPSFLSSSPSSPSLLAFVVFPPRLRRRPPSFLAVVAFLLFFFPPFDSLPSPFPFFLFLFFATGKMAFAICSGTSYSGRQRRARSFCGRVVGYAWCTIRVTSRIGRICGEMRDSSSHFLLRTNVSFCGVADSSCCVSV